MSDVQSIKDALVSLKADIAAEKAEVQGLLDGLKTQVKALQDQIAAGTPVTQADLDQIAAMISDVDAGVKDISEPAAPTV